MDRGWNDVKHGVKPTDSLATGTQTGSGSVYIFHLCSTLLLTSCPGPKLTCITIPLHKRVCICCLSCRVEMGLCVCTQWAVMRSMTVQLTTRNSNTFHSNCCWKLLMTPWWNRKNKMDFWHSLHFQIHVHTPKTLLSYTTRTNSPPSLMKWIHR